MDYVIKMYESVFFFFFLEDFVRRGIANKVSVIYKDILLKGDGYFGLNNVGYDYMNRISGKEHRK